MSVNKKEKKLLQNMWDGAEEQPEGAVPDGKYHFEIIEAEFGESQGNKPRMASVIKVVGGDDEYLDEELSIYDNLETPENMSWFKRKLGRLQIDIPEDFEELIDGTVAEAMEGVVFEGQVKTKDGFLNVYVNKFIGEGKEGEETGEEEAGEETGEEEPEEIEKDDEVTFEDEDGNEISATVVKINAKKKEADVEDENEEVWTVPLDELSIVYEEGDKSEGDEEGSKDFTTPDDVSEMKKKALGEFLESVGLDADDLTSPKDSAMVIAQVKAGEDPKRPWLVKTLKAYGRKPKKEQKDAALVKALLAEIDAAIMGD